MRLLSTRSKNKDPSLVPAKGKNQTKDKDDHDKDHAVEKSDSYKIRVPDDGYRALEELEEVLTDLQDLSVTEEEERDSHSSVSSVIQKLENFSREDRRKKREAAKQALIHIKNLKQTIRKSSCQTQRQTLQAIRDFKRAVLQPSHTGQSDDTSAVTGSTRDFNKPVAQPSHTGQSDNKSFETGTGSITNNNTGITSCGSSVVPANNSKLTQLPSSSSTELVTTNSMSVALAKTVQLMSQQIHSTIEAGQNATHQAYKETERTLFFTDLDEEKLARELRYDSSGVLTISQVHHNVEALVQQLEQALMQISFPAVTSLTESTQKTYQELERMIFFTDLDDNNRSASKEKIATVPLSSDDRSNADVIKHFKKSQGVFQELKVRHGLALLQKQKEQNEKSPSHFCSL